jgi:prepilin-type N-terminal cleavage/methylation domain-containing protein
MRQRKGFTLIELVVALAILLALTSMAFSSFSIILAASKSNQNRETVLEDMSTVLDQLTKELRQTVTVNDGSGSFGVKYPVSSTTRDITTIATPKAPLDSTHYYTFGANNPDAAGDADRPILTFYVLDDAGTKHRISYTLGVPSDSSGKYKGIARQYWASQSYEPCEILYSNETGTEWTSGIDNQPVTGQVITNFTVIRPAWSDKVIQIVLEAMVKNASGGGSTKIIRIAQVTLRQ